MIRIPANYISICIKSYFRTQLFIIYTDSKGQAAFCINNYWLSIWVIKGNIRIKIDAGIKNIKCICKYIEFII